MDIIGIAIDLLEEFCKKHNIPDDHGFDHAMAVYRNAERFLKNVNLSRSENDTIKIACLFHDVDDRKIFPRNEENTSNQQAPDYFYPSLILNYPNATKMLVQLYAENNKPIYHILRMISLVSATSNGNNRDNFMVSPENGEITKCPSYFYIPRDADRLEALGLIGIKRCTDYSKRIRRPLHMPETECPTTMEELRKIVTPERFENYIKGKKFVKSDSMIDHFYDKLLHIGVTSSKYPEIQKEMDERMKEMYEFILCYNKCRKMME